MTAPMTHSPAANRLHDTLAPRHLSLRPRWAAPRAAGYIGVTAAVAAGIWVSLAVPGLAADQTAADQTAADLSPAPPVGNSDPTLAFNLTGVADWSTEMPFLNLMNIARPWVGNASGKWGAMSTSDLKDGGHLDARGWPIRIPEGLSSVTTIWSWSKAPGAMASRAGVYVLRYKGEGEIRLKGVKVIAEKPGQMVFRTEGGLMILDITKTDPRGTGDYLRDIEIVRQDDLDLYEAGQVFDPRFLARIRDARELRFMDWMKTNNSSVTPQTEATLEADGFWRATNVGGVPMEYIVALANQTGTDPWINIPHNAGDAYIRAMADYVKENLDPDLKVHVEYSNEAWNYGFRQTKWLIRQVKEQWGREEYLDYEAKMAVNAALIWRSVYGEAAADRLVTVLGTQALNKKVTERLLSAPIWKAKEPDSYVDPRTVFDEVAVTTYFGGAEVSTAAIRDQVLAMAADPDADLDAWLMENLLDPDYKYSIPRIFGSLTQQAEVIHAAGMKMVAYEGGQHVLHSAFLNVPAEDMATLTRVLTDFIRSDEMATLYQELWDQWAAIGDGAFMQFGDIGEASKSGAWGLWENLDDETPRGTLVQDLNATSTPWWDEPHSPTAYQQGLTLYGNGQDATLIGTDKVDFLVGSEGNEIFYAARGNDGINGGGGTNTMVLSGPARSYAITPEGPGYRVTGPDGSKYVTRIALFNFDDMQGVTLADFMDGKLTAAN